MAKVLIRIRQI